MSGSSSSSASIETASRSPSPTTCVQWHAWGAPIPSTSALAELRLRTSARRQPEAALERGGHAVPGRQYGCVSQEQGAGGLAAALSDAESESYSCRAAAGRQLAAVADREEVALVLEKLLLDPHDTAVTQDAAAALLQRENLIGLRLVLAALSRAETWCTADWLNGEVCNHKSWMIAAGRRDEFVQQLETLTADEDPGVRREALWLLESDPVR